MFPSGTCASGQEYGQHSGSMSGKCVGDDVMVDAAIDAQGDAGGRVAHRDERLGHFFGVLATLDGHDALSRRGNAGVDRQAAADPPAPFEAMQAGGGEDERVVVARVQLAEPRVDVAAHRQELGARELPMQLRDATDAARADSRRRAQHLQQARQAHVRKSARLG